MAASAVRKKAREIAAQVRALRAEYPTLCPNIIAAQLGLSVVSVRAILNKKPKQATRRREKSDGSWQGRFRSE